MPGIATGRQDHCTVTISASMSPMIAMKASAPKSDMSHMARPSLAPYPQLPRLIKGPPVQCRDPVHKL
jgi:hypothetical protein